MKPGPPFVAELWRALGGPEHLVERLSVRGVGDLPSALRVTDLAAAAMGVAGLATSELVGTMTDAVAGVSVDRERASSWFGSAVRPVGWTLPTVWDPLAGNYRANDGWIRLHTNATHHRHRALEVLGVHADLIAVTRAVRRWSATNLEREIVAAGGCAAAMRSRKQWLEHPQGVAVAAEPLLEWHDGTHAEGVSAWHPTVSRPLEGLRVLDLTRVIAGPVATRFLAMLGADVLRIDPPGWEEDALLPNMTLGKRMARIDAKRLDGAARLKDLLAGADVVVHGYRDGALASIGLDAQSRATIRPGLVDVSLDAYGFTGPWASRRGFDSLVQMSSGIAQIGADWAGDDKPTPLPVQALDHTTGYLLAAATLRALTMLRVDGLGRSVRTSLARVGETLVRGGPLPLDGPLVGRIEPSVPLLTPWGEARMLPAALEVQGVPFETAFGPAPLGSGEPVWRDRPSRASEPTWAGHRWGSAGAPRSE